jgi:hypothetical protein
MADQLATPEDLASLLERDDIDRYKATVLVETATAIVQEAAGGQRIVQVVDDTIEIIGTTESWLNLPQIPVTAVTSVTLDGTALTLGTDYKKFGNRLWSRTGWQSNWGQYIGDQYSAASGSGDIAYVFNTGYRYNFAGVSQSEPSGLVIVCTHGYAPGDQELQLGRSAVLSMCTGAYGNPTGLKAESIDDYAATFSALSGQLQASPYLKAAIRRQYGRRGGLVRIG